MNYKKTEMKNHTRHQFWNSNTEVTVDVAGTYQRIYVQQNCEAVIDREVDPDVSPSDNLLNLIDPSMPDSIYWFLRGLVARVQFDEFETHWG